MELGKGFLFFARQKRLAFGDQHFVVDLGFHSRLLRCRVLIKPQLGQPTQQDLGQMQMQMQMEMQMHANPVDAKAATIGTVLRQRKQQTRARITVPQGANTHTREHRPCVRSKEELPQKLAEWTGI